MYCHDFQFLQKEACLVLQQGTDVNPILALTDSCLKLKGTRRQGSEWCWSSHSAKRIPGVSPELRGFQLAPQLNLTTTAPSPGG